MAAAQFGLVVSRDGFNGVSTSYSSFVPSLLHRKNLRFINQLSVRCDGTSRPFRDHYSHSKFAIRSNLVRRTRFEQAKKPGRQAFSVAFAIIGFGAFP
jgi:hypothetical protein